MPEGTLTSQGRVTIPAELRRKLGIQAGDRLHFAEQDGTVVIRPAKTPLANGKPAIRPKKNPLASFLGILHRPGQKPVSVEEMEEGVLEVAGRRWDRIQNQE